MFFRKVVSVLIALIMVCVTPACAVNVSSYVDSVNDHTSGLSDFNTQIKEQGMNHSENIVSKSVVSNVSVSKSVVSNGVVSDKFVFSDSDLNAFRGNASVLYPKMEVNYNQICVSLDEQELCLADWRDKKLEVDDRAEAALFKLNCFKDSFGSVAPVDRIEEYTKLDQDYDQAKADVKKVDSNLVRSEKMVDGLKEKKVHFAQCLKLLDQMQNVDNNNVLSTYEEYSEQANAFDSVKIPESENKESQNNSNINEYVIPEIQSIKNDDNSNTTNEKPPSQIWTERTAHIIIPGASLAIIGTSIYKTYQHLKDLNTHVEHISYLLRRAKELVGVKTECAQIGEKTSFLLDRINSKKTELKYLDRLLYNEIGASYKDPTTKAALRIDERYNILMKSRDDIASEISQFENTIKLNKEEVVNKMTAAKNEIEDIKKEYEGLQDYVKDCGVDADDGIEVVVNELDLMVNSDRCYLAVESVVSVVLTVVTVCMVLDDLGIWTLDSNNYVGHYCNHAVNWVISNTIGRMFSWVI